MRRAPAAWLALRLALPFAALAASAQDFEAVEITTQDLGGGVSVLFGRGGNIGVSVGPDGVILVDDQYAPLTPKVTAAVRELSPAPIRFVINTHWHGDHTGGNENLGEAGALIVAHDNVRRRMSVEQFMKAFDRRVPPSPPAALPVVTFSQTLTLHANGGIEVIHVEPAHTDGDSLVLFRSANALHMGDTFFNGGYPFIDASSGGALDGVIAAASRGLEIADAETKIVPGHGAVAGRSELAAYRDMLAEVRARIARALAEGRSVDEIVAAKPTADLDAKWGGGFMTADAFVRIAAGTLAR